MALSLARVSDERGGERVVGWSSGLRSGGALRRAGCRSRRCVARTGLHREHDPAGVAPRRRRRGIGGAAAGSKLDPFKEEIHRLLSEDPKLPGVRVRELLEPLGCDGGKTILDDYLREVRPLFARRPGRSSGRSIGRGRSASSIVWEPRAEIPVGHGQTRRAWVVVACLGYSRAGAGALVFSQGDRRICWPGSRRCLWRLGRAAARRWSGIARPGIHGHGGPPDGRSSPRSAAS